MWYHWFRCDDVGFASALIVMVIASACSECENWRMFKTRLLLYRMR